MKASCSLEMLQQGADTQVLSTVKRGTLRRRRGALPNERRTYLGEEGLGVTEDNYLPRTNQEGYSAKGNRTFVGEKERDGKVGINGFILRPSFFVLVRQVKKS